MPPEKRDSERPRLAQRALDLMRENGAEVTPADLARSDGVSMHRIEEVFDGEEDMTNAVAEVWLEPHITIMEEVLEADLPSNRKMYEFFVRRFRVNRQRVQDDPAFYGLICDLGAAHFDNVRSFVDLADHYLCQIIAEAQVEGFFAGLEIDEALSLINQMVINYTLPDALRLNMATKLSEEKLAHIVDTIFAGLSAENRGASGVNTLRLADS